MRAQGSEHPASGRLLTITEAGMIERDELELRRGRTVRSRPGTDAIVVGEARHSVGIRNASYADNGTSSGRLAGDAHAPRA